MATTASPYDPIKAVEGMFNGSVTRIAYALKDPFEYGENTKMVLAECAKKFHDALDDCEIQLLDAKWFLEDQLRSIRMRREAKAREMGTAAKRKHDETKDANDQDNSEPASVKKLKVEQALEQSETKEESKSKVPSPTTKPAPSSGTGTAQIPMKNPEVVQRQQPQEDKNASATQTSQSTQPVAKPPEMIKPAVKEQPPADDFAFAKPTPPQGTPEETNEEFNFESMFGEATNDLLGDGSKDDNDLNFDFTTDDISGIPSGNQDPTSLDSLLPGLESYANQMDDNPLNGVHDVSNNVSTTNAQNATNVQSFSNDFDLPNLGGPNIFDDLLDDSLGAVDGVGNFEGDIDLSDQALLDMDFENF